MNLAEYLRKQVKKLDISPIPISDSSRIQDPIKSYIDRYQNHPSILKIQEKMNGSRYENAFSFKTNNTRVSKWIKSLKPGKSTTFQHIPGKIIKNNVDVFTPTMTNLINDNFLQKIYLDNLKFADLHPIYKKGEEKLPGHYRPESVTTHTGKIMEKEM